MQRLAGEVYEISIHAPRVGSDQPRKLEDYWTRLFQSTLPVWGATWADGVKYLKAEISIHAPRVGSDSRTCRIGWHP